MPHALNPIAIAINPTMINCFFSIGSFLSLLGIGIMPIRRRQLNKSSQRFASGLVYFTPKKAHLHQDSTQASATNGIITPRLDHKGYNYDRTPLLDTVVV